MFEDEYNINMAKFVDTVYFSLDGKQPTAFHERIHIGPNRDEPSTVSDKVTEILRQASTCKFIL